MQQRGNAVQWAAAPATRTAAAAIVACPHKATSHAGVNHLSVNSLHMHVRALLQCKSLVKLDLESQK